MIKNINLILVTMILTACSSINSIESPDVEKDPSFADGLTYYMPKKDFLVTMEINERKVSEVKFGTTAAYPDLSKQYVLRYKGNLFGKNTLDVDISESGLLSSTKSKTVSQVSEVFNNLTASIVSAREGGKKGEEKTAPVPCSDGTHIFVYKSSGKYKPCGVNIVIKKQESLSRVVSHVKPSKKEYSGIYYRQNIPYLMTSSSKDLNIASIVFSPSESKIHFLPISETYFSSNDANFTFVDGIPTKYNQDTESELVVLLKLPADILTAYFTAVGTMFDSFKKNDTSEAEALTQSLQLELVKKKYDTCIAAIKTGNDELITELGCGEI